MSARKQLEPKLQHLLEAVERFECVCTDLKDEQMLKRILQAVAGVTNALDAAYLDKTLKK